MPQLTPAQPDREPTVGARLGSTYHKVRDYYHRSPRLRRLIWQNKVMPAVWTTASLFSLAVNIVLIIALLVVGRQLFALKSLVQEGLINGLYDNFVLMDQADIVTTVSVETTIQVVDTIPVVFNLPLNQETEVVLVEDTPIYGATIYLNYAPVPIDIILPAGTPLNINLDLTVPVSQTVPVNLSVPVSLSVPVNIPLSETELHTPFIGLQGVVSPYRLLLSNTPDSAQEVSICQHWWSGWICGILFGNP